MEQSERISNLQQLLTSKSGLALAQGQKQKIDFGRSMNKFMSTWGGR